MAPNLYIEKSRPKFCLDNTKPWISHHICYPTLTKKVFSKNLFSKNLFSFFDKNKYEKLPNGFSSFVLHKIPIPKKT